jgi:sugar phosphate isomerase/epimerase
MFTRRNFLKAAALAPWAGAAVASPKAPGSGDSSGFQPIRRAGGPELKVSLNAYCFSRQLDQEIRNPGSTGVTIMSLLDFCAQHGFDGIDATGYYFPGYPKPPPDEFLYRFKRRAFELGIAISGTGTRNYFITDDKAVRADGVANIKQWVEVASRMGAAVLRVFADDLKRRESWKKALPNSTHEQVEDWVADDLRECAEHGKKHGVIIGVQNHGDFNGTAEDFLRLLRKVGSDWCAPVLDTGYFTTPDPYVDIAKVAPYAVNWTVKQSVFDGGYGKEQIDLVRLMRIVRESGYRGYLPIETLYAKGSDAHPFKLVPAFLEKVRAAIAQTA